MIKYDGADALSSVPRSEFLGTVVPCKLLNGEARKRIGHKGGEGKKNLDKIVLFFILYFTVVPSADDLHRSVLPRSLHTYVLTYCN